MKAIRVMRYGDAHCLELQSLPKPKPNAGEVLVRMKAIGLNFVDIYMRKSDPLLPNFWVNEYESKQCTTKKGLTPLTPYDVHRPALYGICGKALSRFLAVFSGTG